MTLGAEIWGLILAGVAVVIGLVFRAGSTSATNRAAARAAQDQQQTERAARQADAEAARAGAKSRLDEGRF